MGRVSAPACAQAGVERWAGAYSDATVQPIVRKWGWRSNYLLLATFLALAVPLVPHGSARAAVDLGAAQPKEPATHNHSGEGAGLPGTGSQPRLAGPGHGVEASVLKAKQIALSNVDRYFEPSVQAMETVDFLLTPALLVQEAISDETLVSCLRAGDLSPPALKGIGVQFDAIIAHEAASMQRRLTLFVRVLGHAGLVPDGGCLGRATRPRVGLSGSAFGPLGHQHTRGVQRRPGSLSRSRRPV